MTETETWMREAIELSRKGFPAPNPHVGCVIVNQGQVVGRGYHDHAGGPHAEVVALRDAGELGAGADVYVTLEPCNHTGRTPPCALALIQAGVARVFVAILDPDPVAGGGVETLRQVGIKVESGILNEEAQAANLQFLRAFQLGRPVVTLKAAASLDGKIATASGESKWITGSEARAEGHRLRAESGSVLVGYKTVLADDPELTARIEGVINQPVRIVIDPESRLNGKERVFNDAAETIHVTGRPVDLEELLHGFMSRSIRGVLVEGGAGTIERFLTAGLADELELFFGPKLNGNGLAWTGSLSLKNLADAIPLRYRNVRLIGDDLHVSASILKKS